VPVDAALISFGSPVEEGNWPRPRCPRCDHSTVRFSQPHEVESIDSARLRLHGDPDWEPLWINGAFNAAATCQNSACGQVVFTVGTYRVDYAKRYRVDQYSRWYTVDYACPPFLLMRVPRSAPIEVRDGIERASRLLLADPGLAATGLRATVERFLTSQGTASRAANGGFLSAHQRINNWRATCDAPNVADLFMAVKWIGNSGTHEVSDLTIEEVLDGVEFLDEAFHRLFIGPDLDLRAEAVNEAKGPNRPAVPPTPGGTT